MKLALVVCDLLTIAALVAWLRPTGRSPWLALVYAWNPLVILEVAHSGHIDALGALWIAVAAWMLSTGRGMRAAIAFVIAVASKLLPIVLVPLFWKRIRVRDAAVAALVLCRAVFPVPLRGHRCRSAPCRTSSRSSASTDRCSRGWRRCSRRRAAARLAVLAGLGRRRVDAVHAPGGRSGGVGVADGGVAGGRAGHLPVVPALLHAVPVHARDAAARRLDLLGAAGLRRVASLAARAPVVRAGARPVARVRPRRRRDRLRGDSPPAAGRERRGAAYFFSSPAIDATFCFSRASAMV